MGSLPDAPTSWWPQTAVMHFITARETGRLKSGVRIGSLWDLRECALRLSPSFRWLPVGLPWLVEDPLDISHSFAWPRARACLSVFSFWKASSPWIAGPHPGPPHATLNAGHVEAGTTQSPPAGSAPFGRGPTLLVVAPPWSSAVRDRLTGGRGGVT